MAGAVTGKLLLSLTLSLLEPAVQAIVFFFHEKAWQRRDRGHPAATPASMGA
ncbi:DUF2061 domain-containing protein [Polaromonas sp.]|uniref:DUF2061 domain-containing protein n=1 Tax=Polaromonas sp. TaxID=1869339 RepID=UPI00345AD92C